MLFFILVERGLVETLQVLMITPVVGPGAACCLAMYNREVEIQEKMQLGLGKAQKQE